ncbi:hypothetical protein LPB86_07080 [Pedobacter sp. MC2016-14]|uniref:hypothetical protein n=1 Tax=Pedobacter sp. MC2016-14 TaxID=2897327 RepID=UPI001E4503C8|nr:hypothetical protein [Pedobacter sp. MC2016-14]MCD0487985.1 hypothetical protein [Pedobacter sp. MC2016-14]
MKILKQLLIFFTLVTPIGLLAQSKVSGNVYDYDNKSFPLQKVTVRNLSNKQVVTTKAAGQFEILAKQGDVLEFTLLGYHTDSLYLVDLKPKTVLLPTNSTALKEVNIRAATVSPYLNAGPDPNAKAPTRVGTDGLEGKKNTDRAGGITFALGHNRYKKDQQKARMLDARDSLETEIRLNFNEKTVEELTKFKGQELKDFIAYFRPSVARVKSERPFNYAYYIAEAKQTWLKIPVEQRKLAPMPKLKAN